MKEKKLDALCTIMDILIAGLDVLNYKAISLILQYEILEKLVTYFKS